MRAILFCQRATELCYLVVLYEGRTLTGPLSKAEEAKKAEAKNKLLARLRQTI
jgi:hypothetical protein